MRQTKKQEKNYTNANNSNNKSINVDPTSLSIISTVGILRVQKPTIVKPKERPSKALNRVWTEVSQQSTVSQQQQQTFKNSTRQESFEFECAQTQIPDSQPQSHTQSQQDRQKGRRQNKQEDAREAATERQISDVPATYMGSFQI